MEQTKKKVNVLAIVSASIGLFAAIFGFFMGGEITICILEGEYLTVFQFMIGLFQSGGQDALVGMLDLMVILGMLVILTGAVLGLVGGILGKESLLKAAKILAVVAIPVYTAFSWAQMFTWLAATHILMYGQLISWLFGLAFSITMMVAYKQSLKAEKAAA